ncbi:DUF1491 family protein [Nitratireductor kimnyeongensis]|uniref:DUF1491 family protein n=1 Tax=Nitratireductor kimnyeongensis TaxID=430679 RepID=A0ABW0T3Q9_9HYPH|nr:DUF1491 family protein [Nitratireductor kimnyeongensis]QZZ34996.1 DUF1491 family protein [Nitratireductor kimnyeongensis]
MRLTSEFWVSALTKRLFAEGGFATVLQKGAREAGTIFILLRNRLGQQALYGPAAQAVYDEARPNERRFALIAKDSDQAIDKHLERERRFDPDFWLVEIEVMDLDEAERYFEIAAG